MKAEPILDFFGDHPEVGDYIVYPVRSGSDLWMRQAEVVGLVNLETSEGDMVEALRIRVLGTHINCRPIFRSFGRFIIINDRKVLE